MTMTEAQWAQGALNALTAEVNPKIWAQVNSITDPIAKLAALEPLMGRVDRKVYGKYSLSNARPTATGAATATSTTTVPTPTQPTAAELALQRQEAVARARNKASHDAEMYLRSQGLDPANYMHMLTPELDRIASYVGPDDNPTKLFDGATIMQNLLGGELNSKRSGWKTQLDSKFGTGFEDRAIGDSILDTAINEILGRQKTDAMTMLERGKARGIYNDVGYDRGLAEINNDYSTGNASLHSLGHNVLDKYRSQAKNLAGDAWNYYSTLGLGDNFSLDPYIDKFGNIVNSANTNAKGDLLGALGNTNYFDFSNISQKVGGAQGALNLRDDFVTAALEERKRRDSMSRGIGSQGAF